MSDSAKPDPVRLRCKVLQNLRTFFADHDFVETDTPVRLPAPALEDYIDAIPAGERMWLRTSPELHMKRLIAAGYERLYQIGSCFRDGEFGRRHRPEFTMLEWYVAGFDYTQLRQQTIDMLNAVWPESRDMPTTVITVDNAFRTYARVSAKQALADDCFDELLVTKVEPQLGLEGPTFLTDYPIELAALARPKPSDPTLAERWELYVHGLELANAFSELTDAAEQRRRFAATAELRRKDGREVYPLDEPFLAALEHGMPPTAGCALGLDRLLMVIANTSDIADVLPFPDA